LAGTADREIEVELRNRRGRGDVRATGLQPDRLVEAREALDIQLGVELDIGALDRLGERRIDHLGGIAVVAIRVAATAPRHCKRARYDGHG